MLFHVSEFHLQFWQMCKLFANKLYSTNTYFYSPVWIMMVYNNFDAQNLHFICLQISPQIFAILQNFPINNLRDQQFCTPLCELERLVVVLFTGIALEVEVPPGMVCCDYKTFAKVRSKLYGPVVQCPALLLFVALLPCWDSSDYLFRWWRSSDLTLFKL